MKRGTKIGLLVTVFLVMSIFVGAWGWNAYTYNQHSDRLNSLGKQLYMICLEEEERNIRLKNIIKVMDFSSMEDLPQAEVKIFRVFLMDTLNTSYAVLMESRKFLLLGLKEKNLKLKKELFIQSEGLVTVQEAHDAIEKICKQYISPDLREIPKWREPEKRKLETAI